MNSEGAYNEPRGGDVAVCPGCGRWVRFDGGNWFLDGFTSTVASHCTPQWMSDHEYKVVYHREHIDRMIANRAKAVITPFGRVDLDAASASTRLMAAQYLAMERRH